MPNRVIREGLLDSDRIGRLTAEEERFYVRLLLVADDFGRFDGRLSVIKSRCFPILDSISLTMVRAWLSKCQDAGLVKIYEVSGKPYLELIDYNQRLRQKRPRYPGPMNGNCQHDAANGRPESESETNPNPKRN